MQALVLTVSGVYTALGTTRPPLLNANDTRRCPDRSGPFNCSYHCVYHRVKLKTDDKLIRIMKLIMITISSSYIPI